MATAEI